MFDKLIKAFKGRDSETPGEQDSTREKNLAAAAILVEAATQDADFSAAERETILTILEGDLGVSASEARELLAEAEQQVADHIGLYRVTSTIRESFDENERVDLVEMLWEVVLSDGELHDFEANLMRRVSGLIHVSDQQSGAARKRALDRLNRNR
ncbi:MAG: TerB family tellurite resistance protein [Alphaproteobacteria bacterium]|nr:TerB family tellurite resistance protein [Alphaproteobacteria bacterium]